VCVWALGLVGAAQQPKGVSLFNDIINAAELPDLPATGPVGLQHHGGKKGGVWTSTPALGQFRNISIEELK
jgi:hypothetical protein